MVEITVEELKEKMDAGQVHLYDVREPDEFAEFNIGGVLIPLGDIQMKIADGVFEGMEQEEIIVHCRSGKRSMMAQMMLMEAGFSNVKNLTGGVLAWQEKYT